MKDWSLFILKNTFGHKMKNGFNNLCTGESSTSTLDQRKADSSTCMVEPSALRESQPTLEEMILQLETKEEKMGRKGGIQHRMSCVNSSDILRSARNALNQYPRFSLDGKDAMFRSSFTAGKLITSCDMERRLPSVLGGERVMWRKPGVVGKLMGLEAMPVPLNSSYRRERLSAIIRSQNLRRRAEQPEMERRRGAVGSCSRAGYCVMKPVELDIPRGEAGWPMRRFF